jgi:hypothetical protein
VHGKRMAGVIYIICTGIIFFAIGEVYARRKYARWYLTAHMKHHPVFHHLPAPRYSGIMQSDDEYRFRFTLNNKGMRGPGDYAYEKEDGTYRIAVLGDSFTFGFGVETPDTMCVLLEEMLNASEDGQTFQVYNFGVNSYSPITEYLYLKHELIKYDPDLVVLMYDIGDIQDDYFYEPHLVRDAHGEIVACDPFRIRGFPDIKAYLMYYSRYFNLIDQKLIQSLRKMKTLGVANYFSNKRRGVRNKTQILIHPGIDTIAFDKFLMFRPGKKREIVMKHWSRTCTYLLLMKDVLEERDIDFLMVTYPYGHQVGPGQWGKGRAYWAFEANRVYDPGEGFSIIEDFAGRNGIRFVNLYGDFAGSNDTPLYFRNDGHWNENGQRIAAGALYGKVIGYAAQK